MTNEFVKLSPPRRHKLIYSLTVIRGPEGFFQGFGT